MRLQSLLLPALALLLIGAMEPVPQPKPIDPVEGAKMGRALVEKILLAQQQNFTNRGVLQIRDKSRAQTSIPIQFEVQATPATTRNIFRTIPGKEDGRSWSLIVTHDGLKPNVYEYAIHSPGAVNPGISVKTTNAPPITETFAGSDFALVDLGLEFFHWPDQRVTKNQIRKGRACKVLESVNPKPTADSYARVVTWIDNDTSGIVHAEAYGLKDKNKPLKEFDPQNFTQVEGQWQIEQMEISNHQNGSRTRIVFDYDEK
jgi:hypothetical protein